MHYHFYRESRYILLLTENFGALNLLDQLMANNKSTPQTIFGSSFPRDQEYIEVIIFLFFFLQISLRLYMYVHILDLIAILMFLDILIDAIANTLRI